MPFLSNYFELNNILSNRPPRVTVIFSRETYWYTFEITKGHFTAGLSYSQESSRERVSE